MTLDPRIFDNGVPKEHRFLVARALELGFTVFVSQDGDTFLDESRDYDAIIKAIEGIDECLLFFNMCKEGTAAVVLDRDERFTMQDCTLDNQWLVDAVSEFAKVLK